MDITRNGHSRPRIGHWHANRQRARKERANVNMDRSSRNGHAARAWYCVELYDESIGHHSVSASYTTEEEAAKLLDKADKIAPASTHIYYWKSSAKPVADPPNGYSEGPLSIGNKQHP